MNWLKHALLILMAWGMLSTAMAEYRSVDGKGNNKTNPTWGSTLIPLLRLAPSEYGGDGKGDTLGGQNRPNPRLISNSIVAHEKENMPNNRKRTAFIYIWGQFLDHDIDLTDGGGTNIPINCTPTADPLCAGDYMYIPMTRSKLFKLDKNGIRQQLNEITAWIDGSMIYGSDPLLAVYLRTGSGGKLKVTAFDTASVVDKKRLVGDLPPLNIDNFPIANESQVYGYEDLFLSGDIRVNENIELTSMHTLFIREHNHLADEIAAKNPNLSDEEIYQMAREQVIAILQVITYKEWLPALLGDSAIPPYKKYDPKINPGIANEFSTAAFRLHTTINDDVEFFTNDGRPASFVYESKTENGYQLVEKDGEIPLFEAFFNPGMLKQTGIDEILKYAASTLMEEVDNKLVDSLRNFLFAVVPIPGGEISLGLDLGSLNIQRGRDHGLANYNAVREAMGLPRVTSFSQITSNEEVSAKLEILYGSVDNIDLWIGGLAEDHVKASSMGPLFQRILVDQFVRLRDGDRFWYQNIFSSKKIAELEKTTLAKVIRRNTGIYNLQDNVFVLDVTIKGKVFQDKNGDGKFSKSDVALVGQKVLLLNSEGKELASTESNELGQYKFNNFPETGDFKVSAGVKVIDVHISKGDVVQIVDIGITQ